MAQQSGSLSKWDIGHKVDPEHTDWLFQNANFDVNAQIPVPAVKQAGAIEIYLVPAYANYGPNNDIPISMMASIIRGFFHRITYPGICGFRPSPAGWNPTKIVESKFNLDDGSQINQTSLMLESKHK